MPDARIQRRVPQAVLLGELPAFVGDAPGEPGLFFRRQPRRLLRTVGEIEVGHYAKQYGRQAFQQEHPLPAGKAGAVMREFKDRAGEWAAEHQHQGRCHHDHCHRAGALPGREPEGEVEQNTGVKPRLGAAQPEPQQAETPRPSGEDHRRGDDAPAHQYPRDPPPGPDAAQHQIARHFEHAVADGKDPCADRVGLFAHVQVGEHLQPGETDVHAIEDVDEVEQAEERDEPKRHLSQHAAFKRFE
jgi:hypothetical protein